MHDNSNRNGNGVQKVFGSGVKKISIFLKPLFTFVAVEDWVIAIVVISVLAATSVVGTATAYIFR